MLTPFAPPCHLPSLSCARLQLMDANIIGGNEFIGEATLNLAAFFDTALAVGAEQKIKKQYVTLTHPGEDGSQGEIQCQLNLVPQVCLW